jgi:hypothetical protein
VLNKCQFPLYHSPLPPSVNIPEPQFLEWNVLGVVKTRGSNPLDSHHVVWSHYTWAVFKKGFQSLEVGERFHPNSIPCSVLKNGWGKAIKSYFHCPLVFVFLLRYNTWTHREREREREFWLYSKDYLRKRKLDMKKSEIWIGKDKERWSHIQQWVTTIKQIHFPPQAVGTGSDKEM